MSSSHPPRRAERLLEALGAGNSFHDDLIGDLAQEFTTRATRDGERDARNWYYREAARAAPHLLCEWARGLRRADVMRLLGAAGFAYVMTAMLAGFALLVVGSIAGLAGLSWSGATATFGGHSSSALALRLLLSVPGPLLGGAIAARSDRRAPFGTVLALIALWAGMTIVGPAIAGVPSWMQPAPTWFRVVTPISVVAGILTGAAFSLRGWGAERGVAVRD